MAIQTTSEERTKSTEKEYLDWKSVYETCMDLAMYIRGQYDPDMVVGIENGGLIPASIVAYALKKKVTSIHPQAKGWSNEGRILIVDDICDTGETFSNLWSEALHHKPGFEVRLACLFCKPWSNIRPHYFTIWTEKWIVFPWEKVNAL